MQIMIIHYKFLPQSCLYHINVYLVVGFDGCEHYGVHVPIRARQWRHGDATEIGGNGSKRVGHLRPDAKLASVGGGPRRGAGPHV